jgi:hypothetical protein
LYAKLRLRAARKLPTRPPVIAGARAKNRFRKAYKDNWNAIYVKEKKKKR